MKRLKSVLNILKVITMTLVLIGVGMAIIGTSLAILAIPEISVIAISLTAAVIPSAIQSAVPALAHTLVVAISTVFAAIGAIIATLATTIPKSIGLSRQHSVSIAVSLVMLGVVTMSIGLAIWVAPKIGIATMVWMTKLAPTLIQTALPAVGRMIASIGATLVGSATFFIIPTLLKNIYDSGKQYAEQHSLSSSPSFSRAEIFWVNALNERTEAVKRRTALLRDVNLALAEITDDLEADTHELQQKMLQLNIAPSPSSITSFNSLSPSFDHSTESLMNQYEIDDSIPIEDKSVEALLIEAKEIDSGTSELQDLYANYLQKLSSKEFLLSPEEQHVLPSL